MSSSRRGPVAFLVRLLIFAVIFVGIGEVWFRVVTPACEAPDYVHSLEWKLMKYDPAGPREGLWTVGRLAERTGEWRVNSDGWISAQDYVPNTGQDHLLLALLGDSYIEGFLTDATEHVDTYLADELGNDVEVYSFAMSGLYLEQYVALARYASAAYSPDITIVFLGDGDVADSVRDSAPVHNDLWQIKSTDQGFVEVPPTDLSSTGRLRKIVKLSASARYLLYNAKIPLPGQGEARAQEPTQAAGTDGGADAADAALTSRLREAARFLVNKLRSDNPGIPIVFAARGTVARGDRYLPVDQVATTPLNADSLLVQEACEGVPDCYFLDLRPAFSLDWATNHVKFEAADGAHWNAYANQLVARALASFLEEKGLVPGAAAAATPQ